ncbi:MAG TPA: thiamine pyrophosphate-dependent enzyme [Anaeromyxobacter sp.]|nr:thiamine pyrophosphate-dependent enzyme [Anaeromyxobacter sp.]
MRREPDPGLLLREVEEEPEPGRTRFLREFPLGCVVDEEGSADPAQVHLTDEAVRVLYRWMVLSRALDERMVTLQRQGRIGFYVGAVGEEATVVGSAAGMEEGDWIFPSYREHAAALMRGLPLTSFLCGLFGNADDILKGRQMPCHEAWRPGRFLSISSPIATQLPQAVGAAWAARLRGDDMVSLVYFGEGATSAHDFHTGLNFAAVHRVPVVFLCRNNGWAISVPRERQMATETVAQKAHAYGTRAERVDGNDLVAVHGATRRARARAAAGEGPTLLECVTYRMEGHSTSDDPRAYRPESLLEPWRRRDPLQRIRKYLLRRGALDEAADARLRDEIREELLSALRDAESRPPRPSLASLFDDVYAEPLLQQREQLEELEAAVASDPRVSDPRHADA